MLPNVFNQYFEDIERAIQALENVYVERYEQEILTDERVNLRIRVRFLNGYLLELNEAVIFETNRIRHLGYRYHFQNKENCIIFRYDNTPHFPKIKTFPHHKHLMNGKVIDTEKPSILKVIGEASKFNAK